MSENKPLNSSDQEVDLSQIFSKMGLFVDRVFLRLFEGFLFLKRNVLVLIVLFVLGAGLGLFLDKSRTAYDHEIIVMPNFGSTDYLYGKVALLNSKIKENDSLFLQKLGFDTRLKLRNIEITPVIDVYKFVGNDEQRLELVKLMADEGGAAKSIENELTSKNYPFHQLSISTAKKVGQDDFVKPLQEYLNDSKYFSAIQKESLKNLEMSRKENDSILKQINTLLNNFSKNPKGPSSSLVYYNENTQVNDLIKNKELLIKQQGNNRLDKINFDSVIKEISLVTNIKNVKSINGKLKFLAPLLFVGLFIFGSLFVSFYQKLKVKYNK
ncbi:hypothetical protein KBJ98_12570 [Flavobacterium sp. F-328]|uniref:Chain length determinant protein n=1 Tax=Flavobacterium erciyesense TaxID=2825842 RepID=A0ABS5D694_9FLAO|nr:hypothetical protein [Flavobacterium erciyesense]MBQ0909540.1 hypothetical protein [Flavobacterium erciyesense]